MSLDKFLFCAYLLCEGSTYVKIFGAHKISTNPKVQDLLCIAGTRCLVFAIDWPHTRFEGLDTWSFVKKVVEWCDRDDQLTERLFEGNAEDLWLLSELRLATHYSFIPFIVSCIFIKREFYKSTN